MSQRLEEWRRSDYSSFQIGNENEDARSKELPRLAFDISCC